MKSKYIFLFVLLFVALFFSISLSSACIIDAQTGTWYTNLEKIDYEGNLYSYGWNYEIDFDEAKLMPSSINLESLI